jgi:PPM family protein phosphatase
VIADATDADILEQAPIVGGAAARDRGNTTVADSSSAAARAAALQAPRPAQPEGAAYEREEPEPKRHPVRTTLLLVALFALLGGGLYLGWNYTQNQYYVGATDGGQLAIFRGVPGEIAGFDLSSINETSEARLDDLTTVAQDRVKQGIQAESRPDAQRRLYELTSNVASNPNLKPICTPTASGGPSASDPVSPSTPASAGAGTPSGTSASSAPTTPATTPDAPPTDLAPPPVIDPVGCRPVD